MKATGMLRLNSRNHSPNKCLVDALRPHQGCSVTSEPTTTVVHLFGGLSVAVTFGHTDQLGPRGWCMLSPNDGRSYGFSNRARQSGRQVGAFVRFHGTLSIRDIFALERTALLIGTKY